MNLSLPRQLLVLALALAPAAGLSQIQPKSTDIVQEIQAQGAVKLSFTMVFEAEAWKQWKQVVGDDPARLRGQMKHMFSAYVVEDLKLERNDMERSATMTVTSPVGPMIMLDGRYRIPVEKDFRKVNQMGREWFFSGNNSQAGGALSTVRLILPAEARDAQLLEAGKEGQCLVYEIDPPAGSARVFTWLGLTLALVGAVLLALGLKRAPTASSPPPVLPRPSSP